VERTEELLSRPAVECAHDASQLLTYRIHSRFSGRFTTLQFVPPDQLRPKAYTHTYPLPGEVLSTAEPMIFRIQSPKRINVDTDPLGLEFLGGPSFTWFKDSRRSYYLFRSRGAARAYFRLVDSATANARVVVAEAAET